MSGVRELESGAAEARKELSTADWSDLRALAARLRTHEGPFSTHVPPRPQPDGVIVMGYVTLGALAMEAFDFVYAHRLIVPFDWPGWDRGRELLNRRPFDALALSWSETVGLITTLVRQDRFCEGALADAFEHGVMAALFGRLADFAPAV